MSVDSHPDASGVAATEPRPITPEVNNNLSADILSREEAAQPNNAESSSSTPKNAKRPRGSGASSTPTRTSPRKAGHVSQPQPTPATVAADATSTPATSEIAQPYCLCVHTESKSVR